MKFKKLFLFTAVLLTGLIGCKKDDQPSITPAVLSSDPVNAATGIATTSKVTVQFNENINPATVVPSSFFVQQGSTDVAGTVTASGKTAVFTPTVNLEQGKVYTVTVTTAVKDMNGKSLPSNYVSTFTTAPVVDTTAPTVLTTVPLNSATNVTLDKVVAVTFSEAMDPTTINTVNFTLKQGAATVPGAVSYSGTTALYTPTLALTANTVYTATITTGAKDVAGNALAANTIWSFTTGTVATGLAAVNLGSASNYVILAKTAITNVPTSAITGDLGLSPAATSYVTGLSLTNATGYATSAQVTGKVYAADMAAPTSTNLTTAVNDMVTAYNDAAGRPSPDFSELGTGNIGGKTLTPGLYKWTTSVTMPSDVTISGSPNDVWIFQIAGDLTMSNAVHITLLGGALPKNIFWQVSGTVTAGTTSHLEGVVLSMTGITLQTGASLNGRALAQTAVKLDGSVVTKP